MEYGGSGWSGAFLSAGFSVILIQSSVKASKLTNDFSRVLKTRAKVTQKLPSYSQAKPTLLIYPMNEYRILLAHKFTSTYNYMMHDL